MLVLIVSFSLRLRPSCGNGAPQLRPRWPRWCSAKITGGFPRMGAKLYANIRSVIETDCSP
jgi:hypothetical protein